MMSAAAADAFGRPVTESRHCHCLGMTGTATRRRPGPGGIRVLSRSQFQWCGPAAGYPSPPASVRGPSIQVTSDLAWDAAFGEFCVCAAGGLGRGSESGLGSDAAGGGYPSPAWMRRPARRRFLHPAGKLPLRHSPDPEPSRMRPGHPSHGRYWPGSGRARASGSSRARDSVLA